ncbi:NAD(P)H-dependent oxidoreductase [Nocardioides sp. AN3]
MLKLKIIIGSIREGRSADLVAPWVIDRAKNHGAFEVEVLDLVEWKLPLFAETVQSLGDPADPSYSTPVVKGWNERIKDGDVYLFVTPEYNYSIPGVLKNAIDTVWRSDGFRNKPAATVGYSMGVAAGVRAVQALGQIAIEAEMVPLRNAVVIPSVLTAFDGLAPHDPVTEVCLRIALDDLAWWGSALKVARAGGELKPGVPRIREAMMAAGTL